MPDAFLRRVIAQRELEQEEAIIALPVESLLRACRLCGRRIKGGAEWAVRVCEPCGGFKMHFRLEREDAERAAAERRRAGLVALAGLQPQPEESLMSDRSCSKCGKKLRSNNTGDDCWACRQGASTAADAGGGQDDSTPAPKRAKRTDALKRFRTVAAALGVDPDALLTAFCEGWLERVKKSADFGSDA